MGYYALVQLALAGIGVVLLAVVTAGAVALARRARRPARRHLVQRALRRGGEATGRPR